VDFGFSLFHHLYLFSRLLMVFHFAAIFFVGGAAGAQYQITMQKSCSLSIL